MNEPGDHVSRRGPALLTLAMFPILVVMYTRLARSEERELGATFGTEYERYAARVPAFIPRRRVEKPTTPPLPPHLRPL